MRAGVVFARFRAQPLALLGLGVLLALFLLAFLGPLLSPWAYDERDFTAFLEPPSGSHVFGTTQTGGDMFALTMRGMQKSLIIALLIAAFLWMITARIVRGLTVSLREREFVLAARYMGVSDRSIIARHILPNVASLLIVD